MLKGTVAEGRVHAKSGYISGTRAYAGFAETTSGRQLIFAVMVSRYACSAGEMGDKLERLMLAIVAGK